MSIPRGHAGGGLGGAAAGGHPRLSRLGRLLRGPASAAPMRGKATVDFLFPS
jgi:hypothetical protein